MHQKKKQELRMILISLDRTISFRFFFLFSMGLVFIPVVYLSFIFLFHFITVNRPRTPKTNPTVISVTSVSCGPSWRKKVNPTFFLSIYHPTQHRGHISEIVSWFFGMSLTFTANIFTFATKIPGNT